jgi:hypothetical protein
MMIPVFMERNLSWDECFFNNINLIKHLSLRRVAHECPEVFDCASMGGIRFNESQARPRCGFYLEIAGFLKVFDSSLFQVFHHEFILGAG